MKYKVTLKNKVYEVEVEQGEAMLVDEYDAVAPVPAAAPVAAAPAAVAPAAAAPAAAPAPAAVAAGDAVKSPTAPSSFVCACPSMVVVSAPAPMTSTPAGTTKRYLADVPITPFV